MKSMIAFIFMVSIAAISTSGNAQTKTELDNKVRKFLNDHKRDWRDMNVPYEDGQLLHDLIVKNGYKSGLEIGTSTGHSTIWLAWAMSKTGGKVITLE
jgi:predicted O-methyltransferase YrrM